MKPPEILAGIALLLLVIRLALSLTKLKSPKKAKADDPVLKNEDQSQDKQLLTSNTGQQEAKSVIETDPQIVKPTLVIAEDDQQIVDEILKFLKLYFSVISIPGIEQLEKISKEKSIDLILLDMALPKVENFNFGNIVAANKEGKLPIITYTIIDSMLSARKKLIQFSYHTGSLEEKPLLKKINEVLALQLPNPDTADSNL